jgi:hypothetical protein
LGGTSEEYHFVNCKAVLDPEYLFVGRMGISMREYYEWWKDENTPGFMEARAEWDLSSGEWKG